jgi:hypothetical protein
MGLSETGDAVLKRIQHFYGGTVKEFYALTGIDISKRAMELDMHQRDAAGFLFYCS